MIGDVELRRITFEDAARMNQGETIELLPAPGPGWAWVMEDDGSFSLIRAKGDQR